jgi:hypothetical protein
VSNGLRGGQAAKAGAYDYYPQFRLVIHPLI